MTVLETSLANGVRVLGIATESPVGAVAISCSIGSSADPIGAAGLTHLLEHLTVCRRGGSSLRGFLAEAADVGAEAGATTHRDHLVFWFHSVTERLPQLATRLAIYVRCPTTDPADVEREKRIVLDELQAASVDPQEIAIDTAHAQMFGKTGLGGPVGGTERSVRAVTVGDVREFSRSAWQARRFTVAVVSQDPRQTVDAIARSQLGELAPSTNDVPTSSSRRGRRTSHRRARRPRHGYLVLAAELRDLNRNETAAARLLAHAAAGSPQSAIYRELRSTQGLVYDVWGDYADYGSVGLWHVEMSTTWQYQRTVATRAMGTLRALARSFGDGELARTKAQYVGLKSLDLETSLDRVLALAAPNQNGEAASLQRLLATMSGISPEVCGKLFSRILDGVRVNFGSKPLG